MNRIDTLPTRAVIFPGFSETVGFAEPLAREISEGPNALVASVNEDDIIPIADYFENPDKYKDQLEGALAVGHSAGCMGGIAAAQLLAFNFIEPIPFYSIPWRAKNVGLQKNSNPEDGIEIPGKTQAPREVARHPIINRRIMAAPRRYSTVERLVKNPHLFPDGKMLFAFDQDEFGFQSEGSLQVARQHGMHADMLEGLHNEPMYRPRNTLRQVIDSLNATN